MAWILSVFYCLQSPFGLKITHLCIKIRLSTWKIAYPLWRSKTQCCWEHDLGLLIQYYFADSTNHHCWEMISHLQQINHTTPFFSFKHALKIWWWQSSARGFSIQCPTLQYLKMILICKRNRDPNAHIWRTWKRELLGTLSKTPSYLMETN